MNGNDWLAVIVLLTLVAFVCIFDRWRDLDRREAEQADKAASHRRLMDELETKP